MLKINKNVKAENDLVNIWLYSFKQWGKGQADLYLDEIGYCIDSIADNPEIGVNCNHIRKGYKKISVNSHVIFYQCKKDTIEIIRVLHKRMDVEKNI